MDVYALLAATVCAVILTIAMAISSQQGASVDRQWQAAARELKLRYTKRIRREITGSMAQLSVSVSVEEVLVAEAGSSTRVTRFVVHGPFPTGITVRRAGDYFATKPPGDPVLTGDAQFDTRVQLGGPETLLVARLDAPTRKLLADAVEVEVVVGGGDVSLEQPRVATTTQVLVGVVRRLVAVAQCFSLTAEEIPSALERNARNDPIAEVRRRNLVLLNREFPKSAQARRAAEAALDDPEPRIRIEAAGNVNPERGHEVLRAIVEDAALPPAPRVEALTRLLAEWPYAAQAAILDRVLQGPDAELARVAVNAVGAHRDAQRLEAICRLASGASSELRVAVARAIAQVGEPGGEPALLELLRDPHAAVEQAAAEALGQVGTVHAVAALLPLTHGVLTRGSLKEAAREAVRKIQSRIGPAGAGQLSLVEPNAGEGALQLAPDTGAVSVAEAAPPAKPKEPVRQG